MSGERPAAPYLGPVFFASTAFAFLNFSLPIHLRELGADAVVIGGLYTAFTATMLVVRPAVGWALDRFGRKPFFAAAFLFYVLSMAAFSVAEGVAGFYAARFLQGIGASLMWVSARTLVADLHAAEQQGQQMGRLISASVRGSMIGGFYGFTLLGFMPLAEAWSLAFAGYAVSALVGLVLCVARVPETAAAQPESADPLSLTPALRRLLAVVLLSGFAGALIDPIYLIFLKDKFDLSMLALAGAFFPGAIVYAVLPQVAGRWSDRFGRAPMIAAGIALAAAVSASLPWLPALGLVALGYAISAVGWATANPAQDALLAELASSRNRGRLFGWKEAASNLGAALGPLAGGAVYEYGSAELTFAANGALLLATAGLVLAWFSRRALGLAPG